MPCSSLGIILKGTSRFYIESYSLMYSKDRKTWKLYKGALSKDKKVPEFWSFCWAAWHHISNIHFVNPNANEALWDLKCLLWSERRCLRLIRTVTCWSSTACFLQWRPATCSCSPSPGTWGPRPGYRCWAAPCPGGDQVYMVHNSRRTTTRVRPVKRHYIGLHFIYSIIYFNILVFHFLCTITTERILNRRDSRPTFVKLESTHWIKFLIELGWKVPIST